MGSVERVLVLGIVVVIVAILGITIWGASGEEPGAVLPATDGGVVAIAPGSLGGDTGVVEPFPQAGVTPVSEIDRLRSLRQAEAVDRGVEMGNTPEVAAGGTAIGAPVVSGAGLTAATGAMPLENNAVPLITTPVSAPVIVPEKPVAAKSATPGIHTVVTGDSIWKIAHKTYGDANIQEHIDEILSANPSVDPDNLQVGARLTLPGADGKDVARQSPAKQVAALNGSLYEVQKGDTLSGIARAQLGSSTKWKDIYELNRERIQDPASIKAGTTLRLPKN